MSKFLEKYGELTVGEAIELNNLESEKEEFRLVIDNELLNNKIKLKEEK